MRSPLQHEGQDKVVDIAWHLLRKIAKALFWPALVVILWGELSPTIHVPNGWDKLAHVTAYLGLAALATLALGSTKRSGAAILALVVLGVCLEGLQYLTGRDPEVLDALSNGLGAGLGWLLGLAVLAIITRNDIPEWFLVEKSAVPPDTEPQQVIVHRTQLTGAARREIRNHLARASQPAGKSLTSAREQLGSVRSKDRLADGR